MLKYRNLLIRNTTVAIAVANILVANIYANSARLVNPANNHAYQQLDNISALNWNTVKAVCSNMGAHLATPTSQNENDFIFNNFGDYNMWLGATNNNGGTWTWITNEPWQYTNWAGGQPDACGGSNQYLMIWEGHNGKWGDHHTNCGNLISKFVCEWEPDIAVNVYNNDFSTSAGVEWTTRTIATSNGEKFLGASANGFGAGSNTLTVNNLPPHTKVKVDFDLYIINSWDGNVPGVLGVDNWNLTADGTNLLFTNFSNNLNAYQTQSYPNQLRPYGTGGSFTPRTGAFENQHLGYVDATYRLSYTFAHNAVSVALKFTGMQNQPAYDEGWGLDNVRVSVLNIIALPAAVTTDPSVITTTGVRLNGAVNPNGAATAVTFDFGTTTAYGQNLAATPANIAATAAVTSVSATKTGLTCGTTYHYRVKAVNSKGTTLGADKAFTTSACPRDLIITSLNITPYFSAVGQALTARIVIKNQGTMSANGGILSLWLNQAAVAACNTASDSTLAIGTLAAGTSKTFLSINLNSTTAGNKTLRAFADSTCATIETNENNNQKTKNYAVGMPDLTVTSITLTPADPAAGSTFTAQIVVKNQGPINLNYTSFVDLWLNQAANQNCDAAGDFWQEINALAAGASQTFTFSGLTAGTAGNKTLRAYADSWCERVDANRSNNQLTKSYTVQNSN